ncbi:hypothetical protein [Peribacillus aracenensis]|uniref:hypothetical protein n=1 Tax=Peribacillus aracenensis TaxID=2976708 RepID=UPI0021A38BCA|nr:hypothetical protein [Peribacillus sp. BBB004]
MPEKKFEKNERIERVRGTEEDNIELAYKKLCEFQQHYCEVIYKDSGGNIVYDIDPARLAELENIPENTLKQYDFNTVEFPSYERLFESKYKQRFLKNVAAIQPKEIEKRLGSDTLDLTIKRDRELRDSYLQRTKERDLDNDGVPDRIDIDDTRNSVQTTSDLGIVKNMASKETGRVQEKRKERQIDEMEL